MARTMARLTPVQVGLLGGAVALAIVLARLAVAADGDISRFVVAGDLYADPAAVDPDIHVFEGSGGYDGQFFWRLAVEPGEWDLEPAHGVRFDSAYRPPRIGYPVLAWLAAGGQGGLVTWTLVGINVAALGVLVGLGGVLAQRAGKPALWGLLVASAPGFLFALARDLAEPVTLAALVAGIVALHDRRPGIAAAAWSFAVLAREQALVVIAGYGLWRVVQIGRGRERPSREDLPWVVPGLVFAAWQGVLWAATGELPLTAATGNNLSVPFVDLGYGVWRWLHGDLARPEMLAPVQLVLLAALVVVACREAAARLAPPQQWLAVALALTMLAGVSLSRPVWAGPGDLRQLSDVFVLSWVVLLLGGERLPPWLVGASGGVWLATVGFRVAAI
jgi:hypothetical protein